MLNSLVVLHLWKIRTKQKVMGFKIKVLFLMFLSSDRDHVWNVPHAKSMLIQVVYHF